MTPPRGPGGFEFLDERGRPVAVVEHQEPDPLVSDRPTLPAWLNPRTPGGRTVLATLLVIFGVWLLSTRQGTSDTGLPAMAPTVPAAPTVRAPDPAGPGTYRVAHLGPLTGAARTAAQLLGRLGEGDGVVPPVDGSCSSGSAGGAAENRVADAVRRHLPGFGVITATSGLGTRAQLCTLVVWAQQGSTSVAVSIEAPGRHRPRPTTRWQTLSGPTGTLEWVRRVDPARWTVLVAGFGPHQVPGLSALLDLAHDRGMSW